MFASKSEVKRQLKTLGFVIKDNEGNGDCLPYSLIDHLSQLVGYDDTSGSLRELVANYVRENWQRLAREYPDNLAAIIGDEDKAHQRAEQYRRPQEWCEAEFAWICACIFG